MSNNKFLVLDDGDGNEETIYYAFGYIIKDHEGKTLLRLSNGKEFFKTIEITKDNLVHLL